MFKTTLRIIILSLFALSAASLAKNIFAQAKPENLIPDSYIVVFKDSVGNPSEKANAMGKLHGFSVDHSFSSAIKGFSAVIPAARLAQIKQDSEVQFITQDRVVTTQAGQVTTQAVQQVPTGVNRMGVPSSGNTGSGIGVAVIDTGIALSHPDLQANIGGNYSCVKGKRTGDDDNGHGSHVAGTIAAVNNGVGVVGVASKVKLYAVKVLNSQGSGSWSSIICGIDWVTKNANVLNIKVANMSLGGSGSSDNNCGNTNGDALHKAICKSRDAGVTYIVAAGNNGADASTFSPASYNDAVITVSALADSDGKSGGLGATTSYGADDTFATFSNYGNVVDLGAPGVNIYSTWIGNGYNTISGTSMATPHVSGSAALYIAKNPSSSWTQVREGLKALGELKNAGHTDPSNLHPEPIVLTNTL